MHLKLLPSWGYLWQIKATGPLNAIRPDMPQKPSNRWLLEHWLSLRPDGALVPPKSAFRPEAFVERRLLPYISVIELVDDSLAIVRLAGTALRERYEIGRAHV